MSYTFLERPPSVAEYTQLYQGVGWEKFLAADKIETLLHHSLHHVIALQGTQVVGMGRVVGDGAMFFYLQDIAVHPDHQGKGVGRGVMTRLVSWCERSGGEMAFIGLFCAERNKKFYEQFGFKADVVGMYQYLKE